LLVSYREAIDRDIAATLDGISLQQPESARQVDRSSTVAFDAASRIAAGDSGDLVAPYRTCEQQGPARVLATAPSGG